MHTFSREALFEAAWDRPLTTVAAEIGVTSTALKKTCDKHDIPTPGRGYWRAVETGKTFPRPKLRPVKDPRLEEVVIVGARPLPPVVQAAKTAARAALADSDVALARVRARAEATAIRRADARAQCPPDVAEVDAALEPSGEGALESSPDLPRALAATFKALGRTKPDPFGFLHVRGKGVVPIKLGEPSVDRLRRWLLRFAAATETLGHVLTPTETGLMLTVAGESIGFRIEEKGEPHPHIPTPRELADKVRRLKWGDARDPWPATDSVPSGRLTLAIEGASYSGLRRSFADGKAQSLESKLDDMLVAFAAHAALIQERRRQDEERQRQWAIEEARRQQLKAFEKREARRGEFVEAMATHLAERDKLRAVLAHVDSAEDPEARLINVAAWLRRRLAELEALLSPTFLTLSAQAAKVDFDEARAARTKEPEWCYPRAVELQYWSIDAGKGEARSQSGLDWARGAGLLPETIWSTGVDA